MPPGMRQLLVAAAGAFALALGAVALVNGTLAGIAFLLGGALLLAWSVWSLRPRR
jgi:Flp pilus assembly protein TadB